MIALSGDLAVFSPADVLQFLGYVRAHGLAELRRGPESVRVYFEDGRISAATADFDRPRLGAILRRSGRVGEAVLEQGLASAAAGGRPLGEALVDAGALSSDELSAALEDQLLQVLSRVLAWEEGTFQFRAGVCAEVPRLPARASLDRLLFEGLRRLDEHMESTGRAAR